MAFLDLYLGVDHSIVLSIQELRRLFALHLINGHINHHFHVIFKIKSVLAFINASIVIVVDVHHVIIVTILLLHVVEVVYSDALHEWR